MIIFNSSPLIMILQEINEPKLIPLFTKLDKRLIIPREVYDEITYKKAKEILNEFINKKYVILARVKDKKMYERISNRFPALHSGEISVLTMAYPRKKECRIIIDEIHGRNVAKRLGIKCKGVFGLLLELYDKKELSLNSLKALCRKIERSNFRIDFKKLGYEWLLK